MKFVQIIEINTKNMDEIQKLDKEWEAATEGKRTATRAVICKDRDKADRYLVIVEFPSYEDAQKNNDLPETAAFAEKQMPLLDGAPTFFDLDVIEDRT